MQAHQYYFTKENYLMVKKKHWIKRVLKIAVILFTLIFIVFLITIYQFSKPKSDKYIFNKFRSIRYCMSIQ
jgi:lipopolysaccharide/colanic/teichoic acid biosynthesis glycosyltransferase